MIVSPFVLTISTRSTIATTNSIIVGAIELLLGLVAAVAARRTLEPVGYNSATRTDVYETRTDDTNPPSTPSERNNPNNPEHQP